MKPLSLQLYTLREMCKADFFGTLKTVADIGFASVELAGLHGKPPAEVRKVLDDLGLKASSAHGPFPGPDQINEIADTARVLGYEDYVLPWIGPHRFKRLDDIRASAALMQAAAEALQPYGITLGYHNHEHEMAIVGGDIALARFFDAAPGLAAEIDTYWAANFGATDPAAFVKRFAKRCPLLHIKDGSFDKAARVHTAVGAGKMDIPAVIAAADESVLKWLVVELDSCATDMLQAVKDSYAYLTSRNLGAGRG